MDFRGMVQRLPRRDKEHLRYVCGDRPRTRTAVIAGLRESFKIQGSRRCSDCIRLREKLGLQDEVK